MGRGQSMASVVGMTWVTGPASTDQLCVLGEVPGPLCADFLIRKVGITTVPMTPAVRRTGGPVKSLPQHLACSPAQAPCPGPLLSGLRRASKQDWLPHLHPSWGSTSPPAHGHTAVMDREASGRFGPTSSPSPDRPQVPPSGKRRSSVATDTLPHLSCVG